jgi:hypothetical protein
MKRAIFLFAIILCFLNWSCSKIDTENLNLKRSVEKSVADINNAISSISSTKGYQILSASTSALKSEISFTDSISLSLVAGIYDFKPDIFHHREFFIPYMLFKKTGTSDQMIVNIPQKLVFHPRYLHNLNLPDSLLKNDFTIKASDYHYYYSWFNKYDYKLTAGFTLASEDIGSLDIISSGNKESGFSYSSKYTFNDGYNINVSFQSGDTTVSSFALSKAAETLLKETTITVGQDFHKKERQYTLSVGNVDIKRGSGIDSIQVYLDGVLQKKAGAKIIDSADTEGSICHHRDILLTFDDGTTTNLSDLIKPAKEALSTLIDSLHSMNFATNVVDYIAISIYYHSYYLNH